MQDLVEKIKLKGICNKLDYRLLTGACDIHCDMFIKQHNLPDEVLLNRVIELVGNAFGGQEFIELLEE